MESISSTQLWFGRVLSGIAIAFFLMDALGKFLKPAPVIEGSKNLGFPEETIFTMGVLLSIGAILYAIPKTSIVGAIYLTGFLGGALAAHFRIGSPLFTHTLFSVYVAAFMWGGLLLRKPRLLPMLLGN